MDQPLIHAALITLIVVVVYAVLARGLLKASEPAREKCLKLYEKIARSNRVPADVIARMDDNLDDVYSSLAAWRLVFLLMCTVFFVIPLRKLRGRKPVGGYHGIPDSLQADYGRFSTCWILATVANSPLAAAIFAFISLIAIACFMPFHAFTKIILAHAASSFDHRHAH